MTVAEWVLRALSRDPAAGDYAEATQVWTLENALTRLRWAFPTFDALIEGRHVLDFGCGQGWQALGMAKAGAASVLGVDINPATLETARALAAAHPDTAGRLAFAADIPPERLGTFDIVLSKDSTEHFAAPAAVLEYMRRALHPGGRLLITFGPPWYAPYGSHMHFFTRVPWVNLWFSEATVMRVRSRYRQDGARHYAEVESGLNRMSVGRFERLIAGAGLRIESRTYYCVRGLNGLGLLPIVRELFITNVSCVLVPRTGAPPARR